MIRESGLAVISADSLADGARKNRRGAVKGGR